LVQIVEVAFLAGIEEQNVDRPFEFLDFLVRVPFN
jgi:hypothetical protein